MTENTVTIELPLTVYNKLQRLADEEQTQPIDILVRLIEAIEPISGDEQKEDPVFELIGAYHSQQPLIDGIPVSENPDLYLAAEAIGEQVTHLSVKEIAPKFFRSDSVVEN